MSSRLQQRAEIFRRAFERLRDACAQPEDEFVRDAVIQRFEFCYELAWKLLKERLSREDIEARSPKATLEEALKAGLVGDGETWTELHRMRNLTSHTYDEKLARKVYDFVCRQGLKLFGQLAEDADTWKNE